MDFLVVFSILQIFCFFCNVVAVRHRASGVIWQSIDDFEREERKLGKIIYDKHLYKIPETFDVREKWPMCKSLINQIRDQGRCGSCWAVSAASLISDRICIASEGKIQVNISAEDVLSCCKKDICKINNGCQGGVPHLAIEYWVEKGIVSGGPVGSNSGCKPYSENTFEGISPTCKSECTNENYNVSYENDKYFGAFVGLARPRLGPENLTDLQIEIMEYGPIACSINVSDGFKDYEGQDVFTQKDKSQTAEVLHTLIVLGWGEQNGTPYWLFRNTWNDWGDKGFGKILRGTNELEIEDQCVSGYVNTPSHVTLRPEWNPFTLPTEHDFNDHNHDNKKKHFQTGASQSIQASVHLISLMVLFLLLL